MTYDYPEAVVALKMISFEERLVWREDVGIGG